MPLQCTSNQGLRASLWRSEWRSCFHRIRKSLYCRLLAILLSGLRSQRLWVRVPPGTFLGGLSSRFWLIIGVWVLLSQGDHIGSPLLVGV